MQQAVQSEHRHLDELFAEVGRILAGGGDPDERQDAFTGLSEQIDLHLEQEDRLYHASIGVLRPDLEPALQTISEAHRRFRLELAAIADQLERGDLEGARRGFGAFAIRFRHHEALEEDLLHRVDAGLSQA